MQRRAVAAVDSYGSDGHVEIDPTQSSSPAASHKISEQIHHGGVMREAPNVGPNTLFL
jgi:hypothetical protein